MHTRDVHHSMITGDMPEISSLCNFGWYEQINYRNIVKEAQYPYQTERLDRCLLLANNKVNAINKHILTSEGSITPIKTLRSLTPNDVENTTEVKSWKNFDNGVYQQYSEPKNPPEIWVKQKRNPGETVQHQGTVFKTNINQPESKCLLYQDGTDGKVHEIPEFDDIPDLELLQCISIVSA